MVLFLAEHKSEKDPNSYPIVINSNNAKVMFILGTIHIILDNQMKDVVNCSVNKTIIELPFNYVLYVCHCAKKLKILLSSMPWWNSNLCDGWLEMIIYVVLNPSNTAYPDLDRMVF